MRLDAQWIVGFVDGEGCFYVGINAQPTMSVGKQVLPEFVVVQHERDIQILHAFKAYFKCGVVCNNHGPRKAYRVRGLDNLRDKIIPFFEKHKLKTKKRINFEKFRDIVLLMEKGLHLTDEGLLEIEKITNQMNTKGNKTVITTAIDDNLTCPSMELMDVIGDDFLDVIDAD